MGIIHNFDLLKLNFGLSKRVILRYSFYTTEYRSSLNPREIGGMAKKPVTDKEPIIWGHRYWS